MYFTQQAYDIRFEWGLAGVAALAPDCDVLVIVDVLSFCTAVDIAVGREAIVYPYNGPPETLADYAAARQALYARPGRSSAGGYSLSPASLRHIPPGTGLVLPSPNGATLSLAAGTISTLAGCLRNAGAVARQAEKMGRRIGVIAAGERWPDGRLRPALEDLLGAGAIIAHLSGTLSPEAVLARAGFEPMAGDLGRVLTECGSGRELIGRGFAEDVRLAAQHNVSAVAPGLIDGAYRQDGH
jgi:2-phosphosulfolactate phosphatase